MKFEKIEEIPSEFECCFCTSKNFKEFVDAENLMPLATSDFRNPICLEMRMLRASEQTINDFGFLEMNEEEKKYMNNGDMTSMDSSDTFASCTTHPFNSQGDLTCDVIDTCYIPDSNLYINPFDKSDENSPLYSPADSSVISKVKKSTSGDTALRSLGTSPMDEGFKGFGLIDRGSRVSLNDSPIPKHRKARFQGNRHKTRFGEAFDRYSQESLEKKKTCFMASATKIINQHLFGVQNLSGSKSGKNNGSKSTLSVNSIDSRTSPQLEHHRRSKSILKKSDSGNRSGDPESERLISDNMSGYEVPCGSDYSPNKRLSSPTLKHRTFSKTLSKNIPKYQQDYERRTKPLQSQLFLLDDINKDKQTCTESLLGSKLKISSDDISEVSLYICPPPPPMDVSPTEETNLLFYSSVTTTRPNNISKTPSLSSYHVQKTGGP